MLDITPNWHPVFVHFPIALLLVSTLLFLAARLVRQESPLHGQFRIAALWNLWIGYTTALIAAAFGWLAYNSVTHDAPSHEAMTLHRNWALLTLGAFLPAVLWSAVSSRQRFNPGWLFILLLLVPASFLARTGWLGAEVVYHHGIGVESLPRPGDDHSDHNHGSSKQENGHDESGEEGHDHHDHQH